jgi:hypothetical protein
MYNKNPWCLHNSILTPKVITTIIFVAGAAANNIFNEKWREAFDSYKHLAIKSLGIIFKDMINKVLQKFPLEELCPK